MSTLFAERFVYSQPPGFLPRPWQDDCQRMFLEKLAIHQDGQFVFMVAAGVGSGKTKLAAQIAARMLNTKRVMRVVYVCPNRAIQRCVCRTFAQFGIHLAIWNTKRHGQNGEPVSFQGTVMTYQSLQKSRDAHRRFAQQIPTMVIFDEIHHLGDSLQWEDSARGAFELESIMVLGMSGTPYRSDGRAIPFVEYLPASDGLRHFRADFTYSLGQCVAEGLCKRPVFKWLDGVVQVNVNGEMCEHDFKDPPDGELANAFLSAAVSPDSGCRADALKVVTDICRREGRKLIIFVGGDSGAADLATEDATELLPRQLMEIGIGPTEFMSITSTRKDSQQQLEEFGASDAWILITVNMISEGADVPELSAELFLTSITATNTTVQRLGRALRGCNPPEALIFMFRDHRYVPLAEQVERDIDHAIAVRQSKERTGESGSGGGRRRIEMVGMHARLDGVTVNARTYSQAQVDEAASFLVREHHPQTDAWLSIALAMLFPRKESEAA